MSMLPTIANALAEFVYDKNIKFTSFTAPDEVPCFLCLTTIHRDSRLLCVAKDSAKPTCLCCQNSNKKCGSIPREILGAAQFYWNHVRRLQTLAANPDVLDSTDVWRVCLQSGITFSPEEMQAKVAASIPLYARDASKAVRLRNALRCLPDADKTPYGSDDGELEDLPQELKDTLIAQMNEARASGCTAPVCPPNVAGMAPLSRGPSQALSRKRKRNAA
ncbi:uncharacterized protein FSUBG_8465 [Fusarium subglutinans]|uniref:Uncharacterized protein n=1 Tax=Gibberella subglutinans TaxID=42677 RepID=A0A8H5UTI0_GIBSU|nr:uncharacterized protein FSUBG_8465 [Fusarium subglutinans]KAF5597633.1 hypothetical protein FSUBG_8465 [Fusarium subglutinans]